MTVYVIEENWCNGERYDEDYDERTKAIAASNTKDAAQKLIEERKAELIEIAKKYEKNSDGDPIMFKKGGIHEDDGGISFIHSVDDNPFNTHSFGDDMFWWEIKEIPFIST